VNLQDFLARVADAAIANAQDRVPVLSVAGAQGAGKTTITDAFRAQRSGVVIISLDDYYLTKTEREVLARDVHPLFVTRGVPGTHDVAAMHHTLDALMRADETSVTPILQFDKRTDDRKAEPLNFIGKPALIVVEGWCLGALPQTEDQVTPPINALERDEDKDCVWRLTVNGKLREAYRVLFARFDRALYLQAPNFEIVQSWREQQERGLLGRDLTADERSRLTRFIAHYERITRHMLAGGRRAEFVAHLDEARRVTCVEGA
jgi:D-glycerate 3-kinase